MGFTIDALANRWPYLYHLTARSNLPMIRDTRILKSASEFLPATMRSAKQKECVCVTVN